MHLLPEAIGRPQEGGSVSQLFGYETMGAGIPQVGAHPPRELEGLLLQSPSLLFFLTSLSFLLQWIIFPKCCGLILRENSSQQQGARQSPATSEQQYVSPWYLCLLIDPSPLCRSPAISLLPFFSSPTAPPGLLHFPHVPCLAGNG